MSYILRTTKEITQVITEEKEVSLSDYAAIKVKEFREAKGLKQVDITIMTDNALSSGSVSTLEKGGESYYLNLKTLEIVTNALDVHISDLLPKKDE